MSVLVLGHVRFLYLHYESHLNLYEFRFLYQNVVFNEEILSLEGMKLLRDLNIFKRAPN